MARVDEGAPRPGGLGETGRKTESDAEIE